MLSRRQHRDLYDGLRSRDDAHRWASESNGQLCYDTAVSVYSQKYQVMTRKTHSRHKNLASSYYQRWKAGRPLLSMSEDINLAPTLLARFVLRELIRVEQPDATDNSVKALITKLIKDPSSIATLGDRFPPAPKHNVDVYARLAEDVSMCVAYDDNYSPLVERARHATGLEYEYVLREYVRNLGVPFMTEDAMRDEGYAKTPDIKLQAPILVDGCPVNWIESKASFGDDYSHNLQLDQFWGYRNRYGPGMVIYWFGFIQELNCNQSRGLLLAHEFPRNIVTLEDTLVSTSSRAS